MYLYFNYLSRLCVASNRGNLLAATGQDRKAVNLLLLFMRYELRYNNRESNSLKRRLTPSERRFH